MHVMQTAAGRIATIAVRRVSHVNTALRSGNDSLPSSGSSNDRHLLVRATTAMAESGNYDARWEKTWSQKLEPGQAWDAGKSSNVLVDLLSSGKLGNLGDKRVFVPGCGRGYDLVTFIKAGATAAIGLELAPTAVKEANSYVEAHLDADRISSAHVVGGDFFEWTDGDKPFDVGFDYTFFCALSPHMRAKWGPAWHRLLRPGGLLVTLIFPVDEDQNRQGPPWPVTPEMYKEALEPCGFTLRSLEKVPNELSHKGRGGREYLAVWERQE